MKYDKTNRTFDCQPTLTDSQVLQYCRDGFLQLKGVVPEEINQRTFDYLNARITDKSLLYPKRNDTC